MNILPNIENFKTTINLFDESNTISIDDWELALDYMEAIGGKFIYNDVLRIKSWKRLNFDNRLLFPENFTCDERIVARNLGEVNLPENLIIKKGGLILFNSYCLTKIDITKIPYVYIELSLNEPNIRHIHKSMVHLYGKNVTYEELGDMATYTLHNN